MTNVSKTTAASTSKGAEEILLTQIKQEFTTPADAIFDYIEIVEKGIKEANLEASDELNQISHDAVKIGGKIDKNDARFKHLESNLTNIESKISRYYELEQKIETNKINQLVCSFFKYTTFSI